MSSASTKQKDGSKKWWDKKKKQKEVIVPTKVSESWMKDLIGDQGILRDKPKAWESEPQIGMDKIRARTDMGKYLVNFANSSTIHGLNHLAAPHRHPLEKVLAVIFIIAALVCLILLSLIFWKRYQNEAVISIVDVDYRSFSITQPSMLICPVEKYDESKFSTVFAKQGIEDTKEARAFFAFISNATYDEFPNTPIYSATPSAKWLEILWELKPDVKTDRRTQSLRSWVVTERGLCLLFDSLVSDYTSYDWLAPSETRRKLPPAQRLMRQPDFFFSYLNSRRYWVENNWTVVPLPEEIPAYKYEQREETRSINIITHSVLASSFNPIDIPDYIKRGISIEQRHHVGLELNPTEIKTSDAVKSLYVHQRQCKNMDEGRLKLWPIYTQNMCSQECKFDRMLERCGCYPHFARPSPRIPICTARQLRCLGENRDEFIQAYLEAAKTCECLPNCDSVSYEDNLLVHITLFFFVSHDLLCLLKRKAGAPTDAVVNYHIDFPAETVRRELLFGFLDFLTSVGGAAGLFLGASVISFVEIIYYATLRLCWYRIGIRKEKEKKLKIQKMIAKRKNNPFMLRY